MRGVRAGLYVGEERDGKSTGGRHVVVGDGHLIDNRADLRANPPDIVLTKMLDFLLLREDDRKLSTTSQTLAPQRSPPSRCR